MGKPLFFMRITVDAVLINFRTFVVKKVGMSKIEIIQGDITKIKVDAIA